MTENWTVRYNDELEKIKAMRPDLDHSNPLVQYVTQIIAMRVAGVVGREGVPTPEVKDVYGGIVYLYGTLKKGIKRPKKYRKMPFKRCYGNSMDLASMYAGLTYTEGFALGHSIPVEHAWVQNQKGEVIDATWEDAQDCWFFGVELPLYDVVKWCMSNEQDGIFGSLWLNKVKSDQIIAAIEQKKAA